MPSLKPYRNSLTQARLKHLLCYNPKTGTFSRRVSTRKDYRQGTEVGSVHPDGYVMIKVDGVLYRAHRLAFLYVTGSFPTTDIDHKNRKRADNAWCNLREATRSQNKANSTRRTDNKSGYVGVSVFRDKFQASISVKGCRREHLGTFKTAVAASAAYEKRAKVLFGEFIGEQSAFVKTMG